MANLSDVLAEAIEETWNSLAALQSRKSAFDELMSKPNTMADRIRFIIAEVPDSAYDNQQLCVLYWSWMDGCESLTDAMYATSAESICRVRRSIRHQETYVDDPSLHPDEFPSGDADDDGFEDDDDIDEIDDEEDGDLTI